MLFRRVHVHAAAAGWHSRRHARATRRWSAILLDVLCALKPPHLGDGVAVSDTHGMQEVAGSSPAGSTRGGPALSGPLSFPPETLAWCDGRCEPRRRGAKPPDAPGAGRDGPRVRAATRHPDARAARPRLAGALHQDVPGDVRRDA